MPVAPALTYPAARRIAVQGDAALKKRMFLVPQQARSAGLLAIAATPRVLQSNWLYKSSQTLLIQDPTLRSRMFLIGKRRVQVGLIGLNEIRMFPVPYLGNTPTLAISGQQWPTKG